MKTIIKIKEITFADIYEYLNKDFNDSYLLEGFYAMQNVNLRYNNKNGNVYRDNIPGPCERLSNTSEHKTLNNINEVMEWFFARYVNNAASRLSRGYKAA